MKIYFVCCTIKKKKYFDYQIFEESLRILEIPSKKQQVLLNDLLGFSKITKYLFFRNLSDLMLSSVFVTNFY